MSRTQQTPSNGTIRRMGGIERIFYDGYWLRYYAPPPDTPAEKKSLLELLARRTFHHTEPGINTPGDKLDWARRAYDAETDPARKRVTGAMLAGAYFNRAIDILSIVADLAEVGVVVPGENELMVECGNCLKKAEEFGKMVKHYSGEEGIDELWAEPLRAFTMTMQDYYESRYLKISRCMHDIERIAGRMSQLFGGEPVFSDVTPLIDELAGAAKAEVEIFRGDPDIFEVWPRFVAACEGIEQFRPRYSDDLSDRDLLRWRSGTRLLQRGRSVIVYIVGARVPMPKTTSEYFDFCESWSRGEADLDIT